MEDISIICQVIRLRKIHKNYQKLENPDSNRDGFECERETNAFGPNGSLRIGNSHQFLLHISNK